MDNRTNPPGRRRNVFPPDHLTNILIPRRVHTLPSLKKLQKQTRALLAKRGLAVLATVRSSVPHQGLVAVAAAEDLKYILFASPVYTRKYENISKNSAVSLLLDDRSNSELDFMQCTALSIKGDAEVVQDDTEEAERYRTIYLGRHPYLESFVSSPSSALFRVKVSTYSLVSTFQRVDEWSPGE